MVLSEQPIRKCPGVKASRSLGFGESDEIGREFMTALILTNAVVSSSKVKRTLDRVRNRLDLAEFTAAFYKPPKCVALGGIN